MSQADLDRCARDLWPTCPRCDNMAAPTSLYCVECGCFLRVDGPTASVLHSRAMQAATERRQA